jgi:hypothetical protein
LSGITWSYYNDCDCNEPTAWGAMDVKVDGELLQLDKVYRVTTYPWNRWLASTSCWARSSSSLGSTSGGGAKKSPELFTGL